VYLSTESNKHSSLVRKYVNYGQKRFITLAPGWQQGRGQGPEGEEEAEEESGREPDQGSRGSSRSRR